MTGHVEVFGFELFRARRLVANPAALLRDPSPGYDDLPAPGTFGVLEVTPSVASFEVHPARR